MFLHQKKGNAVLLFQDYRYFELPTPICGPCLAKASAKLSPIPEDAPVMTTCLLFGFNVGFSFDELYSSVKMLD
jgi:hypothetical protein